MDPVMYQLKITLKNSKPAIWRRVEVPASISLSDLHMVIQYAMGWENDHLWTFLASRLGKWHDLEEYDPAMKRKPLNTYLTSPKERLNYWYDFGDDWMHVVVLEKILPFNPEVKYPRCVKGKGACPPEDCGGIWGCYSMLEALADPAHEMHEHWKEWIDEFDPDDFSVDVVNAYLSSIKLGRN